VRLFEDCRVGWKITWVLGWEIAHLKVTGFVLGSSLQPEQGTWSSRHSGGRLKSKRGLAPQWEALLQARFEHAATKTWDELGTNWSDEYDIKIVEVYLRSLLMWKETEDENYVFDPRPEGSYRPFNGQPFRPTQRLIKPVNVIECAEGIWGDAPFPRGGTLKDTVDDMRRCWGVVKVNAENPADN